MRTGGTFGTVRARAAFVAGVALVGVATLPVKTALAGEPEVRCAEPTYLIDEMGTIGQPISYSASVGCLPAGDTFSGAVIHWGDGTSSPEPLAPSPPGPFSSVTVAGQHTYTTAGSFRVSIEVTDDQTGQVYERVGHTQLSIAPTRLISRDLTVRRGIARAETIAEVSTPLPPPSLRATIRWGDGTSSPGDVRGVDPELAVSGRHRWRRTGHYSVIVTIADASGRVLARTVSHVLVSGA